MKTKWVMINVRMRRYEEQTCTVCASKFQAARWDAKYCGPNCRKWASRHKKIESQNKIDPYRVTE